MGGTDADRPGITARPKPPLPPKPPLVTKQNGIIHSPTHSFSGILSTVETDEETVIQDSGTVMKEKENGIHDVKIDSISDSVESNISSSGVTVHNMERSIPQAELSSVNNTLPPLSMSATSSDRTNARRTVTRGRPSRRASRHSTENGESGDEACCIRFAGMLRTKAVDIASKSKILPPAKPPKPDNLVKYKGRRRKGSQQNDMPCQHSVGDDFSIDGSRHGVRFVDDDETESSTDYKDFDENSVFLLEFACHCDAQNISKGTGILTEGVESGYYTSDVVKTDEEANVSDSCQPVDKKDSVDSVHETDRQRISSVAEQMKTSEEKSFPHLIEEKAKIVSCQETGSQVIDMENSILTSDASHAVSFEAPPDSENFSDSLISSVMILEQKPEKNNSDICVETIVNSDHEPSPVISSALVTDSNYTETKEIVPEIVKESIQKPKRVKSPPRPPPPQIEKKQPQPVIEAEHIDNKCVISKDKLNFDGETAIEEAKKEETTFAQTLINSMPVEESIPVPEVPQTKKRVTSPPRPPPPKIKEIVLDTKEIMPLSVEKVDDKINHTEQTDDSPNKKQPPQIPTKPDRKRKERLHEKSSLEPLDLSTRDDISQSTKPLSLSPKTFPRSGKQGTRPGRPSTMTSQVKKMELKPREQAESKGKPVMTTVVRNTYLEGLQPLPLLKPSSENKLLPTRPPPPVLIKTEETNSSSNVDSAIEQNAHLLPETSKSIDEINTTPSVESNVIEHKENLNIIKDDAIECKENLNEVKDESLDECLVNAITDSSIDVQEDRSAVTDISLQDTKIDDKLETIATQNAFVRDEIQSSTWPTAAERKKRKEMKSPPRPPPPNRDAIMEKISRQNYETSSLDSRGRKRIKSPPRPSPPNRGKLPLKIEEELASSSVSQSEEKTNITDSTDKNTAKRIKSPPRPPPPVYEKLPLKRIIAEQYQISLTNEAEKLPSDANSTLLAKSSSETHQSENDLPKITKECVAPVPLATEETVADEIDLASSSENKKRVVSPPRPPPPVYEKLSLRRTDKPIIPSLTTPRRKKPSETPNSQKQFMSLQRPSDISCWDSNQFSPNTNVLHEYEEIHPPNEESLDSQKKQPKAPPRIKRNRSRTVEVVAVTPKPEERKRRSHSLTESDVSKKLEDRGLLCTPQQSEIKKLYTTVQKEHGKTKLQEVDVNEEGRTTPGHDKMKLRPLPPPPPPPRCKSRSSMSQSPGSTCLNTSVSEEVKLDVTQENSSCRTNQIVKQIDFPEYDENANISFPSKTEEQKEDETSHNKVTTDKCSDEKITHGFENQSDKSNVTHRKSHSPSSTRSKSPSPSKHRSCSSWYDESDVSGDLGDVDTSSSIKGSAEGINKDESESSMLKQKHVKTKTEQSRTSTFYCDLEDDAFHDCSSELPQVETERPLSSSSLVEKSVQTSPERELGLNSQEKNDHSDDTDDLLDRARTVQMELCLMLERRKRRKGQSHAGEDDTKSSCSYTPSPKSTIPRTKVKIVSNPPESDSFANIESPLTASPVDGRCQLPSTHSSNSELGWQVLSSGESDEDSGELSPTLQKKKQKKAFQIANEIMTSEETFIKSLKLLNEDFREAVEKANKERGGTVISEEAVNSFLKYFPQLQNLNENLLGELKERIEHWEETEKIADVIVKIGPFLKLYCSYIREFDTMEAALDDARRKYPLFDQVTKEFESGPLCKLALKHYMLRPIQRIPLYRLLLQRYLHNLTPDSPDYSDTVTALEIVSDVAERANITLRQGDDFRKLISIQNSLFGQHEVIRPGRVFLKEGELMKLSRKEMQPRWFILFNDSLLYLTSMQQGLFKVNNELPLAGMKVHIPQQQDYQNEFSIISVTRSFTLAARSLEERQEWIDALNKAIEENASKRNTFANVMIQQKRKDEQVDGGFTLGKQAPVWIPDARVTMCQLCTSEFTITFRRHHCRACGKVVCSLCSANQAPLQYRNFNVARVCDECFKKLHEEFEAADPIEKITEESGSCSEVIETDSDSPYAMASIKAQFKGNAKNVGKKNKRQLPSVLKEVCANDQGSTISGYLYRRHRKYWKRFWFVLKDKVLYTYKASEDVAALESVPLLGFRVEVFTKPFEGVEAELLFQLTHPGQFPIVFHADTISSTERWVQAMQHATILE